MSYESLYGFNKPVFRETFNDSFSVQNNRYAKGIISATGVKFENGSAKFTNNTGIIYYASLASKKIPTVRIRLRVNNTQNIKISMLYSNNMILYSEVTTGTTFNLVSTTHSSIYVNGVLTKGTQLFNINTWYEVVLISSTYTLPKLNFFNVGGGGYTRALMNVELVEIYNRQLSASEVKLLYQQNLYSQNQQLPLLLDFDSTRGVIEDRTGRNTLTASNVSVQKIGKVYSAYYKGTNSFITIPNTYLKLTTFTVSIWTKAKNTIYGTGLVGNSAASNVANWALWSGYSGGESLYYRSTSGGGQRSSGFGLKISNWNNYIIVFSNIPPKLFGNGQFVIGGIETPIFDYNTNNYPIYIGNHSSSPWQSNNYDGYVAKVQIFQGIPSNPSDFAAQLYNSQKNMFGL